MGEWRIEIGVEELREVQECGGSGKRNATKKGGNGMKDIWKRNSQELTSRLIWF